jgi:hypothetical protein
LIDEHEVDAACRKGGKRGGMSAKELGVELEGGSGSFDHAAATDAATKSAMARVDSLNEKKIMQEALDRGVSMEKAAAIAGRFCGKRGGGSWDARDVEGYWESFWKAAGKAKAGAKGPPSAAGGRAEEEEEDDDDKEEHEAAEFMRAASDAAMMEVESQDLVKYGLIPEFVGRFPITVAGLYKVQFSFTLSCL